MQFPKGATRMQDNYPYLVFLFSNKRDDKPSEVVMFFERGHVRVLNETKCFSEKDPSIESVPEFQYHPNVQTFVAIVMFMNGG